MTIAARASIEKFLSCSSGAAGLHVTRARLVRTAWLTAGAAGAAGLAVAGCGREPAGSDAQLTGPVTLHTLSAWGDAAFWPAQERINKAFMQRYPNIQIVDNPSRQDYDAKVAAAAASNTLPDIIKVHGTLIQTQARLGWFIPLDDLINRTRGFDPGDFIKVALDLYRYQGKLYALPYDHGPLMLWYNRDLFDKAGVKYPDVNWKLADFLDAARRLNKPVERVWGLSPQFAPAGNIQLHGNLLKPYGAALVNDEETVSTIDAAPAIEALEWWGGLRTRQGVLPAGADLGAVPGGLGNAFAAGLAAMHVGGSWIIPSLIQTAGFRWDCADWPAGPRGRTTASMGSGYGITRDSKARDAAWLYLSTFLGKDKEMLMQELATTGRGSPGRKSFWPAFEKSPGAPPHVGLIAPALDKYAVIGRPIGPATSEVNRILNNQFDQVWAGRIGIADAARAAKREIDAALAAAR